MTKCLLSFHSGNFCDSIGLPPTFQPEEWLCVSASYFAKSLKGIAKSVAETQSHYRGCNAAANPIESRKLPLLNLSRHCNEVLCINLSLLDDLCLFHVMYTAFRYPTASIVPALSLKSAILASGDVDTVR